MWAATAGEGGGARALSPKTPSTYFTTYIQIKIKAHWQKTRRAVDDSVVITALVFRRQKQFQNLAKRLYARRKRAVQQVHIPFLAPLLP
jgi:hypothetical protein